MEPLTAAVMLILGCDHSMIVCRESNEPIRHYQTVEACKSDVDNRVREIDAYPVAVAKCIEVPETVAGEPVSVRWRFDLAGNLMAEAESAKTGRITAKAGTVEMASASNM